ncbi:hypothetical protein [Streptomyces alkaliphilus]|uniref:hypothetical protein n=1 Tax=Streptomyces alkaliphilus TaxID=1472722 RepID=UPI001E546F91|nr:hypothetical protein [Streptomyces alkaliphilus]
MPWSDQPLRLVSELLAEVEVPHWRAYGWAAFELSYAKNGDRAHLGTGRLMRLVVPGRSCRCGAVDTCSPSSCSARRGTI